MANITLAIPNEMHSKLRKHSEIRWSEVIRQLLEKKLEQLELIEKMLSKSKLTLTDVDEIANKIDKAVAKKLSKTLRQR